VDIYEQVISFYERFPLEKQIIGKSAFGRNLYAVKVGDGVPIGLAQYGIHGREFITATLAIEHVKRGVYRGSLWVLPLINPDGALLSSMGIDSVQRGEDREYLLQIHNGDTNFSLWKANGRGVDLNVNFAAKWGKGNKNVRYPCAENYIGEKPFSELETIALKNFTLKVMPDYTVSYHTKGEEIYWYFHQSIYDCVRDKRLATALSTSTGYPLAYASGSTGGYKDWCIQSLGIPSFTVEAGADSFSHPLQGDGLADILKKNKNALYDLSKEYFETQ
jgi:g-D-glutamyl-meso-diaminopimelate peptidase